ncbi:MAG: preprotein translocase subunit SecE [Cyanobacteria bacterium P01_A01_bin.84]
MAKKSEAEIPATDSGFSAGNFVKGTREELEKVVWPTRKQLISESAGVLLMVTLSAAIIYVVDLLFSSLSQAIFEPTSQAAFINLFDGLFI